MNLKEEIRQLEKLAAIQVAHVPSLEQAWRDVVTMPYKFLTSDGRHVTWREAKRRGYAACGEAAAYLAAAGLKEGRKSVKIVIEGSDNFLACGPNYRHAVVIVDGKRLNPYEKQACKAKSKTLMEYSMSGNYVYSDGNRAAGAAQNYQKVVNKICGIPMLPQILKFHKDLLKSGGVAKGKTLLNQFVAQARKNPLGAHLLPQLVAINAFWNSTEGFLSICEGRSRGSMDIASLRGLATAIEVVDQNAGALHTLGGLVAGAGVPAWLAEGAGVILNIIGLGINGDVGAAQIAVQMGVPKELRAVATQIESERKASVPSIPNIPNKRNSNSRTSTPSEGESYSAQTVSAGPPPVMIIVGGAAVIGLGAFLYTRRGK